MKKKINKKHFDYFRNIWNFLKCFFFKINKKNKKNTFQLPPHKTLSVFKKF